MTQRYPNLLTYSPSDLESVCSGITKDISDFEYIASTFDQFAQTSVDFLVDRLNLYFAALFWADKTIQFLEFRAGSGEYGKRLLARGHKLLIDSDINLTISTAFKKNALCFDSYESKLFLQGFFLGQLSDHVSNKTVQPFEFIECINYESPLLPNTGLRLFVPLRVHNKVAGVLELQTLTLDTKSDIPNITFSEWGYDTAKPLLIIADQIAGICTRFDT